MIQQQQHGNTSLMIMSYKELSNSIQTAKDRASVYQLLLKNGIEITPTRTLSGLIRKARNDTDFALVRVLLAAKEKLDQLENINA